MFFSVNNTVSNQVMGPPADVSKPSTKQLETEVQVERTQKENLNPSVIRTVPVHHNELIIKQKSPQQALQEVKTALFLLELYTIEEPITVSQYIRSSLNLIFGRINTPTFDDWNYLIKVIDPSVSFENIISSIDYIYEAYVDKLAPAKKYITPVKTLIEHRAFHQVSIMDILKCQSPVYKPSNKPRSAHEELRVHQFELSIQMQDVTSYSKFMLFHLEYLQEEIKLLGLADVSKQIKQVQKIVDELVPLLTKSFEQCFDSTNVPIEIRFAIMRDLLKIFDKSKDSIEQHLDLLSNVIKKSLFFSDVNQTQIIIKPSSTKHSNNSDHFTNQLEGKNVQIIETDQLSHIMEALNPLSQQKELYACKRNYIEISHITENSSSQEVESSTQIKKILKHVTRGNSSYLKSIESKLKFFESFINKLYKQEQKINLNKIIEEFDDNKTSKTAKSRPQKPKKKPSKSTQKPAVKKTQENSQTVESVKHEKGSIPDLLSTLSAKLTTSIKTGQVKEADFLVIFQFSTILRKMIKDVQHTFREKNPNWIPPKSTYQELKKDTLLCEKEARDHIFMGTCGFEIFLKALYNEDIPALHAIFPQLSFDWHTQLEQLMTREYNRLHLTFKLKHHLNDTYPKSKATYFDSVQSHLEHYSSALTTAKYPIYTTQSLRKRNKKQTPLLEKLSLFKAVSDSIRTKQANVAQNMKLPLFNTVKAIFISQLDSQKALVEYITKEGHPEADKLDQTFSLMGQFQKLIQDSLVKKLTSKNTASLYQEIDTQAVGGQILKLNENKLVELIYSFTKKLDELDGHFDDKLDMTVNLKEALNRLSIIRENIVMLSNYPEKRFMAWHMRSMLYFQVVFEQLYHAQMMAKGLRIQNNHNFLKFQEDLNVTEIMHHKYILNFNLEKGIHYTCLEASNKSNGYVHLLRQAVKDSKLDLKSELKEVIPDENLEMLLKMIELGIHLSTQLIDETMKVIEDHME